MQVATGYTTTITRAPTTTIVSVVSVESEAAADGIVSSLNAATSDPASASAALGLQIDSVSMVEVEVVVAAAGGAGGAIGALVAVLVLALAGGYIWRKRKQERLGTPPGRDPTNLMSNAEPTALAQVNVDIVGAPSSSAGAPVPSAAGRLAKLTASTSKLKDRFGALNLPPRAEGLKDRLGALNLPTRAPKASKTASAPAPADLTQQL